MSVIVKDPRDDKIVYCKGADNVIYQRLSSDYKPHQYLHDGDEIMKKIGRKHYNLYSICCGWFENISCGYKHIDSQTYSDWITKQTKPSSMENRDILIEECYDEIERDLTLLGATAIEDKLQDGVPETIANLAVAGISIWVLTGDKVETAINIGRSCRLLTNQMNREDGSLFVVILMRKYRIKNVMKL